MKWLKEYINYKGMSVLHFEKSIGTRSTIDKAIKANSKLRSDILAKIIEVYTDINPRWLLTGKGDMLLVTEKKNDLEVDSNALVEAYNLNDVEIPRLTEDELIFVRDALLMNEEQVLTDPSIKIWLDYKLKIKEYEVLSKIRLKKEKDPK